MSALPLNELYKKVKQSELGSLWFNDPLMQQDVWPLTALGFDEEQYRVYCKKNVHFTRITLPWLKYLAKLTAKARAREGYSAMQIVQDTTYLTQLNEFLLAHGYSEPGNITDGLLKTVSLKSSSHLVTS